MTTLFRYPFVNWQTEGGEVAVAVLVSDGLPILSEDPRMTSSLLDEHHLVSLFPWSPLPRPPSPCNVNKWNVRSDD
jgi:hypothetical protein